MKKHTGERPYRCAYCIMGFTQKSNMKLHVKRAHSHVGEQPWIWGLGLSVESGWCRYGVGVGLGLLQEHCAPCYPEVGEGSYLSPRRWASMSPH